MIRNVLTARDCSRTERLLWDFAGNRLEDRERDSVAGHLRSCAACAAMARQYESCRRIAGDARATPVPDSRIGWADLEQRIRLEGRRRRPTAAAWVAVPAATAVALVLFVQMARTPAPRTLPVHSDVAASTMDWHPRPIATATRPVNASHERQEKSIVRAVQHAGVHRRRRFVALLTRHAVKSTTPTTSAPPLVATNIDAARQPLRVTADLVAPDSLPPAGQGEAAYVLPDATSDEPATEAKGW